MVLLVFPMFSALCAPLYWFFHWFRLCVCVRTVLGVYQCFEISVCFLYWFFNVFSSVQAAFIVFSQCFRDSEAEKHWEN